MPTSAGCAAASAGAAPRTRSPSLPQWSSTANGHPQPGRRLDAIADLKGASVRAWPKCASAPQAHLVTDGLASLGAAASEVAAYGAIVVSPRKSGELSPFQWVNTVIANVKTAMRGTYHHFDFEKYRHRYLAEAQYRINRRFDLPSLVGRLLVGCRPHAALPRRLAAPRRYKG